MIFKVDLQVTKFIFENSLHSEETFFPCRCGISHFFEFMLLGNSSTAPVFSYNQISLNKQPKTFTLTIESISAISPNSQKHPCFNNVILIILNEQIINAVVI